MDASLNKRIPVRRWFFIGVRLCSAAVVGFRVEKKEFEKMSGRGKGGNVKEKAKSRS